jgi:hypothetical protein
LTNQKVKQRLENFILKPHFFGDSGSGCVRVGRQVPIRSASFYLPYFWLPIFSLFGAVPSMTGQRTSTRY